MAHMLKRIDTGAPADPDKRIRQEWAKSINDFLESWVDPATGERGMTRKQFQHRLELVGCEVSQQTISLWLNGNTSPRPSAMVAIAKVFNAPARIVFPLADAA